MSAAPQPAREEALALAELRAERDRRRAEYLAATRQRSRPRDTAERARLWRVFVEANAAYTGAKGETQ